jgi:hypothetical protein
MQQKSGPQKGPLNLDAPFFALYPLGHPNAMPHATRTKTYMTKSPTSASSHDPSAWPSWWSHRHRR